jgi:hypothetical protein
LGLTHPSPRRANERARAIQRRSSDELIGMDKDPERATASAGGVVNGIETVR